VIHSDLVTHAKKCMVYLGISSASSGIGATLPNVFLLLTLIIGVKAILGAIIILEDVFNNDTNEKISVKKLLELTKKRN
jgi:hypothetical protein